MCPLPAPTGKPWHRPGLQNLDDYDIVQTYAAEYRGTIGYYRLAIDLEFRSLLAGRDWCQGWRLGPA